MEMPVLLDSGLDRLELSDAERQLALASFDAQKEGRAVAVGKAKPTGAKAALRGLIAGGSVLVVIVLGTAGYWLYYVTSAPDAFDSVGIEINNMMPGPINMGGCTQLEARFGAERAPYGCTTDDFEAWRGSVLTKTKS